MMPMSSQESIPGFVEPKSIQPQMIIVIHPGSQYVRIGRASDLNPQTVLHVIARKRLPGGTVHNDDFLPPQVVKTRQLIQEMEDARLQVSLTLQSCLQSDGQRRYATPPQQIAAFNRRSSPEIIEDMGGEWLNPTSDIVVGDDVLLLNPSAEYNVHFPYQRGELHIHAGPGGSLTGILADLRAIWCHVITNYLKIPISSLTHYRAVLVIPDIYNRQYLKELTTLLLMDIGFGGCFLLQDHVAATFGAGLGYACVVDVGDQKTSVSCVEDGISHPNTRVRMEYGGADITQAFHWLLQKCAFPYTTCNPSNKLDAVLLRQLKQNFCHINLDICGSQEKQFVVCQPETAVQKYTLQVGDECIVAPLSLFQPELFGITGIKAMRTQKRSQGDPEDPHDDNYLRETSRRTIKEGGSIGTEASSLPSSQLTEESGMEMSSLISSMGEDDIVVDTIDVVVASTKDAEASPDFIIDADHVLGLDQAVMQSIDRCTSDELKRKMYGCILVVGGGMKFTGIGTWLKNRISLQIPYMYRGEQLDIITSPKDMDPRITAWKGAAILSCLESAHELWIQPADWEKMGVKILRERAPFMW